MTELTCANGSQGGKTQSWSVGGGEAFEIDHDRAFGMILDSSKGRYDFSVRHPDGASISYALVWQNDQWSGVKDQNFVFATAETGVKKLSCTF